MRKKHRIAITSVILLSLYTNGFCATNRVTITTETGVVITPPWVCAQTALKQFTVSAWISPSATTVATERVIMERAVQVPQGNPIGLPADIRLNFRLGIDARGHPFASYHASGMQLTEVRVSSPSNTLSVGGWTHLAGRYDGQNLTLFRDGNPLASVPSAEQPYNGWFPPLLNYAGTVTLGAANKDPTGATTNLDSFLSGTVDEVAVWNGPLSDTQIRTYMNTKPTGTESNLVGYWSFDDGTARDLSTNAIHGTYYNSSNVIENIAFPTTVKIGFSESKHVEIVFETVQDTIYQVQSSNGLVSTNWTPTNTNVAGNGLEMTVLDTNAIWLARFYRVLSF